MVTVVSIAKMKEVANKTYAETIYNLEKYGRATAVRPTGFGKTFMLAKLAHKYGEVLYVYPLHIIKRQVEREYSNKVKNAKFITYQALTLMLGNKEEKELTDDFCERLRETDEFKDIKLIMFDEMHKMGAVKTRKAVTNLLKILKGVPRVGVTATINRTDGFDFIGEFFGYESLVSPYSIQDAIGDGVMQKIYYVKGHYAVLQQNKKNIKAIQKLVSLNKVDRKEIEKINSKIHKMSECINMDEVLNNNIVSCYGKEPKYMKFIVFFQDRAVLTDKHEEVINWFEKAFPSKKVEAIRVTSDTEEYRNNIIELDNLNAEDDKIDLILCIDMLNMGYHVEDVTGVVLLRTTHSNIIYKQQIGRCMSITRRTRPIVFDLVNNVDLEACVLSDENTSTSKPSNPNLDINRLNKNCIEMHDLTVGLKELYERLEELSVRDRVNKAVDLYVNYYMPCGACWSTCKVRAKYLANRLLELIRDGELTRIQTVGDNTEVVKCTDITAEMVVKDYRDYLGNNKDKRSVI